jgi:hypothetical protein
MAVAKLKRFGIYHPKQGALNICCKDDTHEYEYVTSIECETLIRVFHRAQNDFNPEYAKLGKRSTSVGDIITNGDVLFMVRPVGFRRIAKTKDLYKKIMQTDEAIIEILSRKHLTEEEVQLLIENC